MFIPRHPVVENQFCLYNGTDIAGGAGDIIAYAGSVVYLKQDSVNQDAVIDVMKYGVSDEPFGFLYQSIKTGYHSVHPVGAVLPGDFGSSDAIAQPAYDAAGNIVGTQQVPVGVAHLGIWETVHYVCAYDTNSGVVADGDHIKPGQKLYAAANKGMVTNSTDDAASETDPFQRCSSVPVAVVMKGASAAKCTSTINKTAMYPIKIKLLV